MHGRSPDILTAIDSAISSSGRTPDAVLSGDVHNYQRFSRTLNHREIPYIVAGAGGYANDARSMHKLQKGIELEKLPFQTTIKTLKLEKFQQDQPGFLRVTVSPDTLGFEILDRAVRRQRPLALRSFFYLMSRRRSGF